MRRQTGSGFSSSEDVPDGCGLVPQGAAGVGCQGCATAGAPGTGRRVDALAVEALVAHCERDIAERRAGNCGRPMIKIERFHWGMWPSGLAARSRTATGAFPRALTLHLTESFGLN